MSYRKGHRSIEFTLPSVLTGKTVKEIRIIPKSNARFFGIQYVEQEESYISKVSFWDQDAIPVYGGTDAMYKFSGKRIHRGMYQRSNGKRLNADINGALNILKKSNIVSLEALYRRIRGA